MLRFDRSLISVPDTSLIVNVNYYLLRERPAAAQQIYAAYRDGSYQLDRWPQIAGFASLAQAEAAWHTAITRWC